MEEQASSIGVAQNGSCAKFPRTVLKNHIGALIVGSIFPLGRHTSSPGAHSISLAIAPLCKTAGIITPTAGDLPRA